MHETHTDTHPTAATASDVCPEVVELLPWLFNGTLTAEESDRVHGHLRVCEACRQEARQAADVWALSDSHIPSLDLAAYAHGLEPTEVRASDIESHLAACAACSEEFASMTEAQVLPFQATRQTRRAATPYRQWALAASIATLLLAGTLIWNLRQARLLPAADQVPTAWQAHSGSLLTDGFESGDMAAWGAVYTERAEDHTPKDPDDLGMVVSPAGEQLGSLSIPTQHSQDLYGSPWGPAVELSLLPAPHGVMKKG